MTESGHILNRQIEYFEALGMMSALAMQSSLHRGWLVADLERNFVAALRANQVKIYMGPDGNPTAFATWALLDDETHEALLKEGHTPPLEKWASGEHLWIIDIVAPFGHALAVCRDLERNHFGHKRHVYALRRNPDGSIRRSVTLKKRILEQYGL